MQPNLKWTKEDKPDTIGTDVPLLIISIATGRVNVRENSSDIIKDHLLPGNIEVYKA